MPSVLPFAVRCLPGCLRLMTTWFRSASEYVTQFIQLRPATHISVVILALNSEAGRRHSCSAGLSRAICPTADRQTLPDLSTWCPTTNLSPDAAALKEGARLYGLRHWVEQGYRQIALPARSLLETRGPMPLHRTYNHAGPCSDKACACPRDNGFRVLRHMKPSCNNIGRHWRRRWHTPLRTKRKTKLR